MTPELINYYNNLCDAYDGNLKLFVTNHAYTHNALIMRVMLEKSNEVNMYCGEMSVFRKGFYDHIRKENQALGDDMEHGMADVLKKFLTNPEKQLSVLFENYKDKYLSDLIVPLELFKASSVELLKLPDTIANKQYIPHISFTGNERMVRFELNKETHEAVCRIGINKEKESPKQSFENLKAVAKPVVHDGYTFSSSNDLSTSQAY